MKGAVYYNNILAGYVFKENNLFNFTYTNKYLESNTPPISISFPKSKQVHQSSQLFAFFYGLLSDVA